MPRPTFEMARRLRNARTAKGWSQRELSQRAGLPQAHISRIETGAVDLKLSTLQELSRLLDLEVILIPRQALTAVESVVREIEVDVAARPMRSIARKLLTYYQRLAPLHPRDPLVSRLEQLSRDLNALEPVLVQSPETVEALQRLAQAMDAAVETGGLHQLAKPLRKMADIRSALAHPQPDAERPAYTLDDGDDD